MVGFYLSQIENPVDSNILILHISLGVLLFIMSILSYMYTKNIIRLAHLAIVNILLIVITGIIGSGFIILKTNSLYSTYIPYLHMLLAIGIISNYAVMLGIKRTIDGIDK
ncbi:trehalose synthase [Ferroplasma acidiphilum]|uniref:Trehalose synthase n=2 Tax=Ferroplasma acidiphilum TaxID=74969 RepID=A0A7K4FPN6_9ARCH|nr:trehalose synthase [Ferroplasma acidiphilum]